MDPYRSSAVVIPDGEVCGYAGGSTIGQCKAALRIGSEMLGKDLWFRRGRR